MYSYLLIPRFSRFARFLFAVGEKEEETQPNVGDLLEPKEELLSADEEDGEEDAEAEEDAEGELLTEEKPLKPNESQPQSHWTTADEDPGQGSVVPKEEAEEVQHPRDKEGPAAGGASDAAANANGHCKSSDPHPHPLGPGSGPGHVRPLPPSFGVQIVKV
ncbi:GL10695 [Drosophila persimilis]|uniref:GL10695 n=1 Tax=Drosophila persimilis TaxID=7234 RepID=B4GAK4_DROPE|nr:GL10695 [Drosophila persimilis]